MAERRRFARTGSICAAALLLVGAAWFAWESPSLRLKDRVLPRKLEVVEPGAIWRSGQIDARLVRDVLRERSIGVVIDLQQPEGNGNQLAEAAAIRELGLESRVIPMPGDGCAPSESLAQAVAALADARKHGKPVLVHCTSGARRTGAVLALYFRLVERDPAAAERELTRVDGSEGRVEALRRHLDDHRDEVRRRLVELGTIAPDSGTR